MTAMFNVEAEQVVLGAILMNNDTLARMAGLEPLHFYDPTHAMMFEVFRETINGGKLVSPVTMKFRLEESLKDLGGAGYLVRLAGAAIMSGIGDVAQHVRALWARRDLAAALEEAQERLAAGEGGEVAEIADDLAGRIAVNLASSSARPPSHSFRRSIIETVREVNAAYAGDEVPGVSTGLIALDGAIGSLRHGRVCILAGRPSMGKSAIALHIAASAAEAGKRVIFASLEMTEFDVTNRLLSRFMHLKGVRVPYFDIERGAMSEGQMRAFIEAAQAHENFPWATVDRQNRELSRLVTAVRATEKTMKGVDLVVVDHLGLISVREARTTFEAVGRASKAMKDLAISLNCPVLLLAQLNREVEARDDKRPRLSDLRQSGEIEEDADNIVMVYRDEYYLEREGVPTGDSTKASEARSTYYARLNASRGIIELGIEKNRSGPVTRVKVRGDLAVNAITDREEDKRPQETMDLG